MSDPGFYQYLREQAPVSSLIDSRIYPDRAPQGTLAPYLVYARTGAIRQELHCGVDGLVKGAYQIDCYALTSAQAAAVHRAVRIAVQGYSGLMGNVLVKRAHLATDFPSIESEQNLFRVTQLWDIWFIEPQE